MNQPSTPRPDVRELFTSAMRNVPGAVAIIASSKDGQFRGLAATAWCSMSADPPSILVCINRSASAHDMIVESGVFSVNQLAVGHDEVVAIFSNQRGLKDHARFTNADWRVGETGAPILLDAVTAYDCHVAARLEHGTHSIFVGNVVGVHAQAKQSLPVSYLGGQLCRVSPIAA